jgi:ABC-type phosphate transport system permease subunit
MVGRIMMTRQTIFDQASMFLGGITAIFLVLALMIAPYIVSVIANIGRPAGSVTRWARRRREASKPQRPLST